MKKNDNVFSVANVILFLKWFLAMPDSEPINWKVADFYVDNKLDVFDFCLLKKALIQGMITNNN